MIRAMRWCALVALAPLEAGAFEFDVGGIPVRFDNLVTVGGLMRLEGRDNDLIGKSNLQPGLCVSTTARDAEGNPTAFAGDTCTTSNGTDTGTPSESNLAYVAAPGSYSPNGDNGNLSFDRYDLVHAAAKLTTDINVSIEEFNIFVRTLYFFDAQYDDHTVDHPDTTMQPAHTDFSSAGKHRLGDDFKFLDWFVSRPFTAFERDFSIKVGNQVINWGESSFLLLNSLNTLNPPDQGRLRIPGFDIKELLQPVGMVSLNGQLFGDTGFEVFYQYDWKPIIIDPVGSFFSTSDTLGDGGRYAMLSFGKAPEDPDEFYQPRLNPDDPIGLLQSTSDRTVQRDLDEEKRRKPDDGGQYGIALKTWLESFNNGTEIAFYFANYHSRIPSVSFHAADETCIPASTGNAATNLAAFAASCLVPMREPIPVGSATLFAEYPEDIHLFGVSFNTNVGNWALSGEYAYRPNLPIQLHTADLTYAALQPAFPVEDFDVGISVLPGRRSAVPDFAETTYRGHTVTGGQYIRGYERMKVGQLGVTALRVFGGDNLLRASQITLLIETGWTHVFNMPGLDEVQFQGAEVNTHISAGADGSEGINPEDIRSDPDDEHSTVTEPGLRQNPTRQKKHGFGTQDSAGYRLVGLTRYDDAFLGVNVEILTAIFHDVYGVSPGLGMNFVEDRLQAIGGLRLDYLNTYSGELRYTFYYDGAELDNQRDRDNLMVFVGYQF